MKQLSFLPEPEIDISQNDIYSGKRYSLVYTDPPWDFDVYDEKTTGDRWVGRKYKVMTPDDLTQIKVADICSDDAVLFLWCVWRSMEDCFMVANSWGFEYKTLAWEWIKLTKTGKMWHFGTGYYTRGNPEPCLIFTKGDGLKRCDKGISEVLDTNISPVRAHSQKPDETYERIERMYPREHYPNRIELFASRLSAPKALRYGYDVVGYDIGTEVFETVKMIANGKPESF